MVPVWAVPGATILPCLSLALVILVPTPLASLPAPTIGHMVPLLTLVPFLITHSTTTMILSRSGGDARKGKWTSLLP